MVLRELPVDEWPRLSATHWGEHWRVLPAADTTLLVVEHEGEIVGCWALIRYAHVEGIWIHPAHRGRGPVFRHLWTGMLALAQRLGIRAAFTAAETEAVSRLIKHVGGQPLPEAEHFVLPLGR